MRNVSITSKITNGVSRAWLFILIAFLAISCAQLSGQPQKGKADFNSEPVYDYPITNPYAATVIGLPPEMKVDYDAPAVKDRKITIFNDRKIPEGFWYERGLKYGELLQSHAAPLVYVIAGTGADHHAEKMRVIANILYSAGFSVILLPSPTHPNFIINAGENFTPGRPIQDAKDLYRAMEIIDHNVSTKTTITARMLTGYSLGALDAAFTARLDDEQKVLNFSKVLLINPPYSLYSSVKIIDNMLYGALPNGIDDADRFIKTAIIRLSSVSQSGDALDFSNERLFLDAYNKYQPSDNRLATTIGLSFRLSAANMVFTADVMGHDGYIFPKNEEFTTSTHLNEYMGVVLRTSLSNYFDELYSEKYLATNPGMSKSDLAAESGLQSLASYISHNNKFGLISNADDIILAPGEINQLAAIFGANAVIFNTGGHTGNLAHPAMAYHIDKFMKGQPW